MAGPYTLSWTGAVDHATWSTGGNWYDQGAQAAASNPPASQDVAQLVSGTDNINAGLNQSGVNLSCLSSGPQFNGIVGSIGSSLTISVANTTGPSPVNTSGATGTVVPFLSSLSGGAYVNITAGSSGITTAVVQGGVFNLEGGTTTSLQVAGGTVLIDTSAVVTNLYGVGGAITARYNATAFTLAEICASSFTAARLCTTLNVSGGGVATITSNGNAPISVGSTGSTSVGAFVRNGGTFVYQSSGYVYNVVGLPGANVLASGNPWASFIVQNSMAAKGVILFPNSPVNVNMTNQTVYIGQPT